ncbi:MAG: MFS transporter, partial [Acidimicrobiaceae bacterium]|nr:MFS transporter [Acidimicrobiaceae bacterium]
MPTTSSPTRSVVIATFATVMLAAAVAQGFGRFTFGVVLPDVREDILGGSNSLGGFVA